MCGRFSLKKTADAIMDELGIETWPDQAQWLPGYNLAPTRETPVIVGREHERELRLMRWGLIPFWAKDSSIGNRLINARSETITEKNSFRHLVPTQRCGVVAQGYFEWQRQGGSKKPHVIYLPHGQLMTMAGLWDFWEGDDGQVVHSYTIITTTPAADIADLHDRMPVILCPEHLASWVDDRTGPDQAVDLLQPYEGELDYHEVSTVVNNVRHDEPACIEPKQEDQGRLF